MVSLFLLFFLSILLFSVGFQNKCHRGFYDKLRSETELHIVDGDFGPRFDASQGVSLGILGGFAIFQYRISSAIKVGNEILEKQEVLRKILQKAKVEKLVTADDEKIRLEIDALATEIAELKKDELQKRTFISLPGVVLRFRSPVQVDGTPSEDDDDGSTLSQEETKTDGTDSNSSGNSNRGGDLPRTDDADGKRLLDLRDTEKTNPLEPVAVLFSVVAVVVLVSLLPLLMTDPMSSASSSTATPPTSSRPFGTITSNDNNGRSSLSTNMPMYQGFDIFDPNSEAATK